MREVKGLDLLGQISKVIVLVFVMAVAVSCDARNTTTVGPTSNVVTPTEALALVMGPYDQAVLPIEDVLLSSDPRVLNPSFRIAFRQANFEIISVLKDPRKVPVERFIFYNQEGHDLISHPDAERISARFIDGLGSAVAVYVRTTSEEIVLEFTVDGKTQRELRGQYDPFYIPRTEEERSELGGNWTPWSGLFIPDTQTSLLFPCMPQVIDDQDEFVSPFTGNAFDTESYLPPLPRYPEISYSMEANEIREGWLLCLAPDLDIQEIQVGGELRGPETYLPFATRTIWSYPLNLQMGDWHSLENVEVVGWNESADSPKVVTVRPNSSGAYSPPEDAERIYLGPVWVSVATGFISEHATHAADTDVAVEQQLRISMQMYFPGMEDMLETWDQIAFENPVHVFLFADETFEDEISAFRGIYLRGRGYWLLIDSRGGEIDQDLQTVWAKLDTSPLIAGTVGLDFLELRAPTWRMDLNKVRSETTSTDEICLAVECVEISKDTFIPETEITTARLYSDGSLPLATKGEFWNGISIKDAWFYSGNILFQTTGPTLVFVDTDFDGGDKWLFVEVESYSGFSERMGINWDIFYEIEDSIIHETVWPATLHEDRNGTLVVTRNIITQLRRSSSGMVLMGAVPGDWTLDRIILVHHDGGPAWRLE